MRLNLMTHLNLIVRMLILEPVLRFLLTKGLIAKKDSDTIKNPYTNQSDAARKQALVEHIFEDDKKVTGFMDALRQDGQTELAELIETAEDENALRAAAQAGQSTIVKDLLKKGVNTDATDDQEVTALMFAALSGHVECVGTLLGGGASADYLTRLGTALHVAVRYVQEETTTFLLNHTTKHHLEAKDSSGFTVLHWAAMRGHIGIFRRVFRKLCEHGIRLGSLTEDGGSCLHLAAQEGHGEIVVFILQSSEGPALLNAKGKGGKTALMRAAKNGHVAVAADLLAWGADPLLSAADGRTALHFAAIGEAPDMFQLLLQLTMDINQRSKFGDTPIMVAARNGHFESVALLAESGAELDLADKNGFTALHLAAAASEGALATVEALIAAGADVRKVADYGMTCLHLAALKGNADVAGFLADGRLSPNVLDCKCLTPLHIAAREGYSQTAKALLRLGADRDPIAIDEHHNTPLNLAARMGHLKAVAVLLSFGANPAIRDLEGSSPKDCAVREGHTDVVRLLEEHKQKAAARRPADGALRDYVTFRSVSTKALMDKLIQFNSSEEVGAKEKLVVEDLDAFESILEGRTAPTEQVVKALENAVRWPTACLVPILDVLRVALLSPLPNEHFFGAEALGPAFVRHTLLPLLAEAQNGANVPLQILVCRCVANGVSLEAGRELLGKDSRLANEELVGAMAATLACPKAAAQTAAASALANLALALHCRKNGQATTERQAFVRALGRGLAGLGDVGALAQPALLLLLQAIVTALYGDSPAINVAKGLRIDRLAARAKDAYTGDEGKAVARAIEIMIQAEVELDWP